LPTVVTIHLRLRDRSRLIDDSQLAFKPIKGLAMLPH